MDRGEETTRRYLPLLLLTGCLDYASVSHSRLIPDGGKADQLGDGGVQGDGPLSSTDLAGGDLANVPSADLSGPPPDMCGVVHDNGLGQTWTDCVAYATSNATQAGKACAASGGTCESTLCRNGSGDTFNGIWAVGSGHVWLYDSLQENTLYAFTLDGGGGCLLGALAGYWR